MLGAMAERLRSIERWVETFGQTLAPVPGQRCGHIPSNPDIAALYIEARTQFIASSSRLISSLVYAVVEDIAVCLRGNERHVEWGGILQPFVSVSAVGCSAVDDIGFLLCPRVTPLPRTMIRPLVN